MKFPYFLGILALALIAFSCDNSKPVRRNSARHVEIPPANPYAGNVYFFAPKLDRYTCEVYGDCECCWDNLLFIDDYRFVRIYYCEADRDYRRGTYILRNDSVFLNYTSVEIEHELNWDWDEDKVLDSSDINGYTFTTTPVEELQDTLTTVDCNGSKRFKTGKVDDVYFGQPDIIKPMSEYLKEMRQDSIDAILEIAL